MNRSLADKRKKEMIELQKEGKTLVEIAQEVGLSKRQVQFNLNKEADDPDRAYRNGWNQMRMREKVPEGCFNTYERMNWLI
jgi:orotate phosphoribosyltransferase-like protein